MRMRSAGCSHQNLSHLLADPLIQLVMQADRVATSEIEELFQRISGPTSSGEMPLEGVSVAEHVAIHPHPDPSYRSGVRMMLLNAENKIFIGQRIAPPGGGWQMPQGGIELGEHPRDAALRELREEIGTDRVAFLAESRGWLRYDLPAELVGIAWGGRWQGQRQKWFGMRFLGTDADIAIATEHPEFSAWRWARPTQIADLIVAFKRQLYLNVFDEFQAIDTE
jgi:putative (di)nucleoside polyphosphate hydrolase